MAIIEARQYSEGKASEQPIDLAQGGAPPEGTFDWVGLCEPTADEIALVQKRYDLHPLAIEDSMTRGQAAKAESYGDELFIVARTADMGEGESIAYGQTAIFLGANFIVTVRLGSTRPHTDLRKTLAQHPERLSEGPDFVAHALLDFIVDGYNPLLDELENHVAEMEEGAISSFPDQARIRRIFRLRRAMRKFENVAGQMEEVAGKLANLKLPCIDESARPFFRDVYDHARRAVGRAHGLSETLGTIIEIAGLLEQSRQGTITRQLASWAAILAVPTAIAGIYGMNFRFMPELNWQYGYPAVLATIGGTCALLYWRFRKIGWL